jgi:hypothetical protein
MAMAGLAVAAQATHDWRLWGCAVASGFRGCAPPRVWNWADIQPVYVVVFAVVGALIALATGALARRERRRRQQWGEM